MNNIETILRTGAALFELGARAFAAAQGDTDVALGLIKDRSDEIAALEQANNERARRAILGDPT